jgi:4-amino-4-deoxy-L-arabinose transferase-like glycosyltransferase
MIDLGNLNGGSVSVQTRSFIAQKPITIIYLIAGYFTLSIVFRILWPGGLENDEAEQAFTSQFLFFGYGSQPPLYNWLLYGLTSLFGISVAMLSVLKNSLLFLCCLFCGFAARNLVEDKSLPAIAMLSVLSLPAVFLLSQRDLSHTVAAFFAVSLYLYALTLTLKKPSLGSYLLVGIATGIGLLSKYNFAVLPPAALLAILPEPDLRKRIFDWRLTLSIAVALIIVAPHANWILHNMTEASGQTLAEMKHGSETNKLPHALLGTLSLANAFIRGMAPAVAVFVLVFYRDLGKILRARNQWTRMVGRMLIACLVIVFIVVLAIGAIQIREKWLAPYFLLMPLYLILKVDAAGVDVNRRLPAFLAIVAVLTVGVLVMLFTRIIAGPMIGRYADINIPYDGLAKIIRSDAQSDTPVIVAPGFGFTGNMRIQFPRSTVLQPQMLQDASLAANLGKEPVVLVWPDKNGNAPPSWVASAAGSMGVNVTPENIRRVDVPYRYGAKDDVYHFSLLRIERAE